MAESLRSKEGSLTLIALIAGGVLPLLIVFGSARLLPMPRAVRSVLDVRLQHSHGERQMGDPGFSTDHSFLR